MSSSPAWKNPRDRLAKHAKRKSSRVLLLSQPTTSSATVDLNTESCPPMTANPGLANPFKIRSPTKKRVRVSEEEPLKELQFDFDDSTANDSFSTSVKSKIQEVTDSPKLGRSRSMQVFGEYSLDFSDIRNVFGRTSSTSSSPAIPEPKFSSTLPQDLRLGTKLRVTSKLPFPWMKNTKSTGNVLVRVSGEDRSRGMQRFIDYPEDTGLLQTSPVAANPMSLLEAASFYWQYPALPWLSLYPRIESLLKSQPKQSAPPLAPTMTDLINKQWFDSLDQLYISWKKGERKNFYVVCPSFTVLFNKTSQTVTEDPEEDSVSCFQVADGQRHVAIISPTNLGFRQYLKKEGVSFELCSYKRRRLSRLRTEESLDNADSSRMSSSIDPASEKRDVLDEIDIFEDNNDENETAVKKPSVTSDQEEESPTKGTSGVQEWLEAVGVSPRNQLKLQRHKSMISTVTTLQGSNPKDVDRDVTSAVIITEGASLQSLYNLLQNSKVTRSIAGPHANLPPTLIASKPFLFGQMLSLKKMSQVLKRQGQPTEYVLELDGGPVMQHSIELMSQFVHSAGLTGTFPASIRINDRSAYAGLNGIDQSNEWNEIAVEKDGYSWK